MTTTETATSTKAPAGVITCACGRLLPRLRVPGAVRCSGCGRWTKETPRETKA